MPCVIDPDFVIAHRSDTVQISVLMKVGSTRAISARCSITRSPAAVGGRSPTVATRCYRCEVPRFQLSQRATNTRPLELRQQYQNLESEEVEGGARL
jgi:hypothetical protein